MSLLKSRVARQYYPHTTVVVLSAVSLAAFSHFFLQNTVLAFFDAKAHLHIAKQITNGLNPGFVQLGGVWLPLLHLFLLPSIWIDKLYHTGIAGSLVSMGAFVGASLFFLKLSCLLLNDTKAAIFALLTFALNPNLLYLQSLPMTESLYLLTFVASFYFLSRWILSENHRDLILAAFWIFLATWTRYEGWGWMICASILVLFVCIKRKYGYSKTEGLLFAFLPLEGLGVFLWLLWNQAIFKNPLYFALGEYSSRHIIHTALHEAGLPLTITRGDLILSLGEYLYTVMVNHGIGVYALFVIGVIITAIQKAGAEDKRIRWAYCLLFPFLFHLASIFFGHSMILVPNLSGMHIRAIFGARFGITMLPAVALFTGYLSKGSFRQIVIIGGLVLLQYAYMFATGDIVTLKDARYGWSNGDPRPVEKWLRRNYDEGLILVDAQANSCRFIDTRIPMDRFIHQGTNQFWTRALTHPAQYASWIWLRQNESDRVWKAISENREFKARYKQVFRDKETAVYRRIQIGVSK